MTFSERHASIGASHRGQEGAALVPMIAEEYLGPLVCLKDIRAFDKTAFRPVFA
jgi:hypothetical protein